MSVLYKALAKAAKANQSARDDGDSLPPHLAHMVSAPPPRRRTPIRRIALLSTTGLLATTLTMMLVFGDDLIPMLEELAAVTSDAPEPRRLTPVQPRRTAAKPEQPQTPPAEAPVAVPAQPTPTEPPATAQAPAQPTPPAPLPPAVAQAVQPPAAAPPANKPAPPAEPAVQPVNPSEDLPALLAQIRRNGQGRSIKAPVEIDRTITSEDEALRGRAQTRAADTVTMAAGPSATVRDELQTAHGALTRGQYETAAQLYADILKAEPDNRAAMVGRASALHKLRRFAEAKPIYEKVLMVEPNNREALTNYTSMLAGEAPTVAIAKLRELQQANPAFSPIAAQLAGAHAQAGDLPQAILQMSQAIALAPDNLLYRYNLAVLQDRADMREEAAASYELVLQAARPGAPVPVDQVRERLRFLKSR